MSVLSIVIEAFYEKYFPMVLRRCRSMLGEWEAGDAAQDVFVKLLGGREKLHGRFPSSLLFTIATNTCLNRLRWRRRHAEVSHEDLDEGAFFAEDRGYSQVEARMIMEAIFAAESEQTRAMCFLYHADGMSLAEIGAALGLSASGVRKRLISFGRRARLKEKLYE